VKDLPNLQAKDNPKDPIIQPRHMSKYREKLLIRKERKWVLNQWRVEENLQDDRL
jgi:hypothetical protein